VETVLEQELASIISYIADKTHTSPYYYEVPRNFVIPAVYYPVPEIITGGETLSSYRMDYIWYIKFFHKSVHEAYNIGLCVLTAMKEDRNRIPFINEDGGRIDGCWLRINDPELKGLENGTAQLAVSWRSRRPYKDMQEVTQRSQSFYLDMFLKSGKQVSDAYAETLEQYAVPLEE